MYALQLVRSVVFVCLMYFLLLPWGLVFAIPAIFSRRAAIFCCRSYCWFIMWLAGWMIGLKCEVRGEPLNTPASSLPNTSPFWTS